MADREKVIKGLECCILRNPDDHARCSQCSYDSNCVNRLKMDALELLKEQEAKPVELHTNSYGTKFYFCPKCKRELFYTRNLNFCERCGQAVKWDG